MIEFEVNYLENGSINKNVLDIREMMVQTRKDGNFSSQSKWFMELLLKLTRETKEGKCKEVIFEFAYPGPISCK